MSARRKNIMLGTAGHVDHGKTALVKLLTGCDTDTLSEEKQRGLTIDLGFAPCRLADDRVVGIVDVPGHVDFIRNMVAGAHGLDVVIFIVAADDGIMPQTHEHLHILTLMGVRHGLAALTKIDMVEPSRRSAVMADLRRLLAGTFLENAAICPISNVTGEGFDDFFAALNQAVDACAERPGAGLFRLWVEDAFSIRGAGTVITGIPTSGVVRVGDHLRLLPAGRAVRVRRMQVYGEDTTEGRAGECVALNVTDLELEAVHRGMVLSESEVFQAVSMAEAQLEMLRPVQTRIKDYTEVQLHVGTASVSAHLAMLETHEMTGGQSQVVQLRLAQPLPLAPGDRFVVRANVAIAGQSGLTTIGGGRILGVSNQRLRRQRAWTLERLKQRQAALDQPARWCELMLQESTQPLTMAELQNACRMHEDELRSMLRALCSAGRVVQTRDGAFLHGTTLAQANTSLLGALDTVHQAQPQRTGLSRAEVFALVKVPAEILSLAIEHLLAAGQITWNGTVLARPGWQATLSSQEQQFADRVAAAFQEARWVSPTAADLAVAWKESPDRVARNIQMLIERGLLVRLDERLCLHRDAIEAAQKIVLELFARAPSFSTMEFRDALGVSRKYAVPLLDYLDAARFTVRTGHNRTPGAEARKRMG